jgi:hypothetical protein
MSIPRPIQIRLPYNDWAKLAELAEQSARRNNDAWLMDLAAELSECIGHTAIAAGLRSESARIQNRSGS